MMSDSVDMRPSLGSILKSYQNYSYKPETAIAEFVDNSVESYRQHKPLLELQYGSDFQLQIIVNYDQKTETLKIVDNAFGMDFQTFQDALKIAKVPKDTSGRNEYGMGLKTAASWFGNCWTITSISPTDKVQYQATVDVDSLIQSDKNEVEIRRNVNDVNLHEHGTVVSIKVGQRHKINVKNFNVLVKRLTSLYRRDISDNNVKIVVQGQELRYTQPEIGTRENDGLTELLKKNFDETIAHDGSNYRIKGFIAIRKIGSTEDAGFTLFHRGRVIVGGPNENYRPKLIFGNSNSFQYQRLFGEIDLDDFPVTQSKDAFDWELSGLRDAFDEKMKAISAEYVKIAQTHRVRESNTELSSMSAPKTTVAAALSDAHSNQDNVAPKITSSISNKVAKESVSPSKTSQVPLDVPINKTLNVFGATYQFEIIYTKSMINPASDIVYIEDSIDGDNIKLTINLNFSLFAKQNYDPQFLKNIEEMYMMLAIAERRSKMLSHQDGLVTPDSVRMDINELLKDLKNNEEAFNELFNK